MVTDSRLLKLAEVHFLKLIELFKGLQTKVWLGRSLVEHPIEPVWGAHKRSLNTKTSNSLSVPNKAAI